MTRATLRAATYNSADRALITGACSGIGREIATLLASRGHELVLVSQRPVELQATADVLTAEYGVRTHAIPLDLATTDAAGRLVAVLDERGLDIDIAILNAGLFFFGEVADVDPARAAAMLELHVVTPSLLAHHLGARMRTRRHGHILFMSSISAWGDFPGIAFYGSSKRYLRSFAAALRSELGVWGVNVTLVAPGATATPLFHGTPLEPGGVGRSALADRLMGDPTFVAREAVEAMFARKAEVIPGLHWRVMAGLASVTPTWLIDRLRQHAPWLSRP